MSKDTPDLSPTSPKTPRGATPASTPVTPPAAAAAPQASTPPASPQGAFASPQVPAPVAAQEAPDDLVMEAVRPNVFARLGAEAVGTFFLVLVGLGIALYTKLSGVGAVGVGLGFGLALVAATIAFGHISGGHFNPAVTIGSAIAGRTPWIDVPLYWLAQIIGGALGAVVLFLTIPAKLPALLTQSAQSGQAAAPVAKETVRSFFSTTANGVGSHSPLATLSQGQVQFDTVPALIIEIAATAVLVGVVLCATNRRTQRSLAPFAIGLTYAVLIMMTSPITNGGLNPARSTAAVLFSDGWAFKQLGLFWLAPIIGAALAGLAYLAFSTQPAEGNLLEEDGLLVEQEIVVDDVRA